MHEEYIRHMMAKKTLSQETEINLAKAWILHNDENALCDLVESHAKLAVKIAYGFRYYGLNMQDIIQEGIVGLIKAAQRYNPNYNIRFSGYAKWWIRSTIQDYILKNWSIVRMSSSKSHKMLFFNLNRIKKQIYKIEEGNLPEHCINNMSELLNVSAKDIAHVDDRLTQSDVSLNAHLFNSTQNYQEHLVDLDPIQDEIAQKQNTIKKQLEHIQNALEVLNDQEKHIVINRYLKDEQSFSTLGAALGLTKESIRQIEIKAFRKMRHHLIYISKVKKDEIYIE